LEQNHEVVFDNNIVKSWTTDCGIRADGRAGCSIICLLKDLGHSLLITDGELHVAMLDAKLLYYTVVPKDFGSKITINGAITMKKILPVSKMVLLLTIAVAVDAWSMNTAEILGGWNTEAVQGLTALVDYSLDSDSGGQRYSSEKKTAQLDSSPATVIKYRALKGNYRGNVKTKSFHRPSCRVCNSKECVARFKTREQALKAGYRPCKVCKP
jgi:hypothetical protein